ncbi:MAG: hypothetical protein P8X82_18515 [Gemmatimonadales bacterium]|jgi:hypothetical protein
MVVVTSDSYKHAGVRALVTLHARYLRAFVATWRRADSTAVELPTTADPAYASRETLLTHVLGCAARYLTWICDKLELAAPNLEGHPEPEGFAARADEYLEDVLQAWELHLREVTAEMTDRTAYESWWGVPYCIDAMLEHAVMHPMRHAYQLDALLAKQEGTLMS